MQKDIIQYPQSLDVSVGNPTIQKLSDDIVLITISGSQVDMRGKTAGFTIRGTICCVKVNGGWLANNIHTSVPNSEVEKYSLKKELDEKRRYEGMLFTKMTLS